MTPEAVEPLFDKRMEGFAPSSTASATTRSAPRRSSRGRRRGSPARTFVFCLPGSPGACRDAWDGILVKQFDYRQAPCNFVEIMPRLDEHLKRGKLKSAKRRKRVAAD